MPPNTTRQPGSTRAAGECNISDTYYVITEHRCYHLDKDILEIPVRLGGLCHPSREASREYAPSVKVTTPQVHQHISNAPATRWVFSYVNTIRHQSRKSRRTNRKDREDKGKCTTEDQATNQNAIVSRDIYLQCPFYHQAQQQFPWNMGVTFPYADRGVSRI